MDARRHKLTNDLLFLYKTCTSYVTVLTILTTRQMRQIFTSRPGTRVSEQDERS
jgi:hypothetical protein